MCFLAISETHLELTPIHPQPLLFPKNARVSINKIRGYSKVSNQGNQYCFQRCTAQQQRWSHLCLCFNYLLLHFDGGGDGGDCALSPISKDKRQPNYFVWMLMIAFH